MRQRHLLNRRSLTQVLGLLALLVLVQAFLWFWQPMFYNRFEMTNKGVPYFRWVPDLPICDEQGNMAKADFRRNVLVLFLTSGKQYSPAQFWLPRRVPGGVAFPTQLSPGDDTQFVVPNTIDRLVMFAADGTRRDLELVPGEAERIFNAMQAYSRMQAYSGLCPALVPLVENALIAGHSSDDTVEFARIAAELQRNVNGP